MVGVSCDVTWLVREILRVRLCKLAGSLSLVRSMLHPHDSMVFRVSLIGQRYTSLSCRTGTKTEALTDKEE